MFSALPLDFHLQSPLNGGANQHQRTVGGHFPVVAGDDQTADQDSQTAHGTEKPAPKPPDLSLTPILERAPKGDAKRYHQGGQRKIHHMPKKRHPKSFISLSEVQVL